MNRQNLILYRTENGNLRTVIKTKHGRIVYWELMPSGGQFHVKDCYYLDRMRSGKYYATPQKQVTTVFDKAEVLTIAAMQLDRTYSGCEIKKALAELTTEEFISSELNKLKKGYKFLIFIGDGNPVNGLPQILTTRLANRIHRKI